MNEQANIFVEKLEQHAETGKPFNIFTPVTLCALDIICETAMGKTVNAQEHGDSEYVQAIYSATDIIQERQKFPWLWLDFIFYNTRRGKEFQRSLKILHDFTDSVIKERRNILQNKEDSGNKKRRLAFLDLLLEASQDGEVLTNEDIREEVDTFMLEGHDTTAAGMAWAFHLIGSHPEVQQKIHDQLDSVFGDDHSRDITPEDLRKLDYLECVIKESLRLFPSVPFIGRTTTSDCKIDGNYIPTGTQCIVCMQVINHHESHWKNPEKFDPDRFTVENSDGRHPYAYIPFSAGPRNCIGQKFALMEEKVV